MPVTLIHHSERFDRPVERVHRDAKVFREIADIVTRTEMGGSDREGSLVAPDWSWVRAERDAGHDETVVEWSNAAIGMCGMPFTSELTDKTYFRETGAKAPTVKALVTPLNRTAQPRRRRFMLITAHMALDNTPLRAETWIAQCAGVVDLVREVRGYDPSAKVVLAMDFNKNYRDPAERAMIERHLCDPLGLKQAWAGFVPEHGGTHGNQIIDGWLVDLDIKVERTWLLDDTDGSDHRPCATTLSNL